MKSDLACEILLVRFFPKDVGTNGKKTLLCNKCYVGVYSLGLAVLAIATIPAEKPGLSPKRLMCGTHVSDLDAALD